MFRIFDGRESFYQGDIDRKLIVEDETIKEVHFCNGSEECSLVCEVFTEDNKRIVNVPNILLQSCKRVRAYGYSENHTRYCKVFNVVKRSKPEDYIYTETEIKSYKNLETRINEIESKGVSSESLNKAVAEYLEANPIETDLSDYYTKQETENAILKALGVIENGTY